MEKILQFGEGNFLRAFAEEYIQNAGEKVVVCQPRTNTRIINLLKKDSSYDIIMRGKCSGKEINERKKNTAISRAVDFVGEYGEIEKLFCSDELKTVISNTTEAGIAFCSSDSEGDTFNMAFPGKIAKLLFKRYKAKKEPLIFLPAELIDDNGGELKKCIAEYARLWGYDNGFFDYLEKNHFCSTLVDRIVSGHPDGDGDPCSVVCEPYKSLVIKADDYARSVLPKDSTITYTNDLGKYRERKVKLLNGGHTMSVPAAIMSGFETVYEMMQSKLFSDYIEKGFGEIKQTINLPQSEADSFAESVKERFDNPFLNHRLSDISLNSIAKYKVRVLPSIADYRKINNEYPKTLAFSFAALIAFYTHTGTLRQYSLRDDDGVIAFFKNDENIVKRTLENGDFWECSLTKDPIFEEQVQKYFDKISKNGIEAAMSEEVYGK